MEKSIVENSMEKKEKNTAMIIKSPIPQDSYNIQMMKAVDRNPQLFTSLHPHKQANLARDLQRTYGNQHVQRLITSQKKYENDETPLQTKKENTNNPHESKSNNKTGLPDRLKENIENLSGLGLDDVRVHYNSNKPKKLDALAYTYGTDIYVAPGQEKYLPHETWHAVQQKQGRVQPTMQVHGIDINDNKELEREADAIGEKAMQMVSKSSKVKKGYEIQQQNLISVVVQNKLVQRQCPEGPHYREDMLNYSDDCLEKIIMWTKPVLSFSISKEELTFDRVLRYTNGGIKSSLVNFACGSDFRTRPINCKEGKKPGPVKKFFQDVGGFTESLFVSKSENNTIEKSENNTIKDLDEAYKLSEEISDYLSIVIPEKEELSNVKDLLGKTRKFLSKLLILKDAIEIELEILEIIEKIIDLQNVRDLSSITSDEAKKIDELFTLIGNLGKRLPNGAWSGVFEAFINFGEKGVLENMVKIKKERYRQLDEPEYCTTGDSRCRFTRP